MPSYAENVYYHPEATGLETVAEVEAREAYYSFDIFLIVREKSTGKVYVADDSGCSCPSPFEYHDFPQDFTEVHSWDDVKREYASRFPSGNSMNHVRQRVVGAFRRAS